MIRVAAAALCVLVGLYWLGQSGAGTPTGGGGFRLLDAIFIGFWLVAAMYPLRAQRIGTGASTILPVVALGVGLLAVVGPWLLNNWISADFDRYVWVIHHVDPCSGLGGGPGMLWTIGTSGLAASPVSSAAFSWQPFCTSVIEQTEGGSRGRERDHREAHGATRGAAPQSDEHQRWAGWHN